MPKSSTTRTNEIGRDTWRNRQGMEVSNGFQEARIRQERDKTKVGELTCIFQTIHGLIDVEDDEPLAVLTGANEGKERETGKDCGGVGIDVDSDKLALGYR